MNPTESKRRDHFVEDVMALLLRLKNSEVGRYASLGFGKDRHGMFQGFYLEFRLPLKDIPTPKSESWEMFALAKQLAQNTNGHAKYAPLWSDGQIGFEHDQQARSESKPAGIYVELFFKFDRPMPANHPPFRTWLNNIQAKHPDAVWHD
ncbi:MAG: hypothetical protein PXY39_02965 [archaeon]|nr:hypothetical protein [archaeon]